MEDNKLELKVKYFSKEIEKLTREKVGDWIDLRAAETVELRAGEFKLIPLGVGMILPEGYEAHIVPRSSTFKTWGIIQTNHMGVIDNSYSGDNDQWRFPAYATRDTIIKKAIEFASSESLRIYQILILWRLKNLMILVVVDLVAQGQTNARCSL